MIAQEAPEVVGEPRRGEELGALGALDECIHADGAGGFDVTGRRHCEDAISVNLRALPAGRTAG